MDEKLKYAMKRKQIEFTLKTSEYKQSITELGQKIAKNSSLAKNEASVVSVFELELFSFIKDFLNIRYYPEKEIQIDTEIHVSKGRIDSKIGALVIEFKHKSKLKTIKQQEKASTQLIQYLNGLYSQNQTDYLGLITDGTKCKFIRNENGTIREETFGDIQYYHLDTLIKNIVLLSKKALSPENLVKDFCTPEDENIAKTLTYQLIEALENDPTDRSLMLFNEWKELFRLAHDDKSKQKAIAERKAALSKIVDRELKNKDEEYLVLYAIQTTYAIIVKIIAYKVISKIRFNKSFIDFNTLANADHETLRLQLYSLEEGAIFRSLGIGNLLEGDFFAWYSTKQQWNTDIAKTVQKIFTVLAKYEDKAIFETGENIQDLFKDLFLKIMPDKVRHSLGEFYTPPWLADNLISEALLFIDHKNNWKALDPCAGSGTFVTVLIKKVLEETVELPQKQRLNEVLRRVKAIDLNPLAVLTTRINYFINISPLMGDTDIFEIPVYLGDSSYVAEQVTIENVVCLKYKIKTIKKHINIEIPRSAITNPDLFSQTMTSIEEDIKNSDCDSITQKLLQIIAEKDKKPIIVEKIVELANTFIELEQNDWNGIWARIVTNFLTTANIGHFDLIVGNPPWIDWKNLPTGYQDRIKSVCVERHLFSGDGITGGINLNVCALISNVAAQNWLKDDGILALLMPQSLVFQQSYEGFRNFELDDNRRLYFQHLFDWTLSGHPFKPVTEKFLSFFISSNVKDYSKGIPLRYYIKQKGTNLIDYHNTYDFKKICGIFEQKDIVVGQVNKSNTIFSYADDEKELEKFKNVSGESFYIGREGIEFYPQELFLLEIDKTMPISDNKIYVTNYQNNRSKYKIPPSTYIIEKKYLHPLIKGVNIERFHIKQSQYLVPFPYDESNCRSPIDIQTLNKKSPLLAKYLNNFKDIIESQTNYNDRIIGKKHTNEFYALARVGEYSFAKNHVVFRDNTKWQAAVATEIETEWGGLKRPLFQNHAVSICQTNGGRFITLDEAHYICATLNAPIIGKYILNSSDSRSFKIRPPIFIPEFDEQNPIHINLSNLSKSAHRDYLDKTKMKHINEKLDILCLKLADS